MGFFGNKEDETFLAAPKVAGNPESIDSITSKYIILYNQSIHDIKFIDLSKAINKMAEKGWRCVNISAIQASSTIMYALMERQ